jgi:hypothetical protein
VSSELATISNMPIANVQDVKERVDAIRALMKTVMVEGKDGHYGKIPGCGDKPALFKSGAEKLGVLFMLTAEFKVDVRMLADGRHREFTVTCLLYSNIDADTRVLRGQGIGIGSTRESKYLYTWEPIRKWVVASPLEPGERQRNGMVEVKAEKADPADYLNTVVKMAKKRAFVDAMLTTTSASDIFTQDIDEKLGETADATTQDATATPAPEPAKATPPPPPPGASKKNTKAAKPTGAPPPPPGAKKAEPAPEPAAEEPAADAEAEEATAGNEQADALDVDDAAEADETEGQSTLPTHLGPIKHSKTNGPHALSEAEIKTLKMDAAKQILANGHKWNWWTDDHTKALQLHIVDLNSRGDNAE